MRILFIRNTGRFSGSETYNINLFKELRQRSSLDIVFLTNLSILAERSIKLGVKTQLTLWGGEGVGTKKQLLRIFFTLPEVILRYLVLIKKLEREGRFTIICLQSMTEKIFLTPIYKAMGYKIVWTELGPLYATQMSRVVTGLYRFTSLWADKIVTISRDTRNDLIRGGIRPDKISAIYVGIDTNEFAPLNEKDVVISKKRNNIPTDVTVVGFLGTVTYEKGIDDFISISRALLRKRKKFHFIVIGNGPSLFVTKEVIRKNRLMNYYTFTRFTQDVTKYLGLIDILLLPTRHYEGLSLALLEAQSMGKVVITSRMGGNPEIVTHGVNGFIYTTFNTAVVELISNLSQHRSHIIAIGKKARENVLERFNITKQARAFYRAVVNL